MILINATKKTVITKDLKELRSWLDLTFGLLRNSNPRSLMMKTRFGIHTFRLNKPIDVVVLDSNFRVVKLEQSLKPNSLFFWNPKYNLVIELPSGTIKKTDTTLGCYLKLKLL